MRKNLKKFKNIYQNILFYSEFYKKNIRPLNEIKNNLIIVNERLYKS